MKKYEKIENKWTEADLGLKTIKTIKSHGKSNFQPSAFGGVEQIFCRILVAGNILESRSKSLRYAT